MNITTVFHGHNSSNATKQDIPWKNSWKEDIKLTHLLQVHFPSMVDFNRITEYSTVIQPIWNQ